MSAVVKPIEGQSYLIRNNGEWGVIVVEPASGLFMAYSGYGAYCHNWYSTGEGGLMKFLTRLEYSYAMGKWVGASYGTRFDHEKTVLNVKRLIIERRREEQITEGAARDAWMALVEMDYMFDEGGLHPLHHERP